MNNEFVKKPEPKVEKEKPRKAAKRTATERSASSRTISQILNGEFLTKEFVLNNLNFIFFLMLLLLLTVGKGYYGKQLSQDVDRTQKELDEVTAEYVEAKAKLEENTRRQVLVEKLESRGLKETVNPTKVIRIKEKED